MRAHLICVGERMPAWVDAAYKEYAKRLSKELSLNLVEIPLGVRGKTPDLTKALATETRSILAAIAKNTHVVALDVRGELWDSEQLAQQLQNWRMTGRDLAFLIGGPDGFGKEVLDRADQRWSLGPLTLPHPIVRIVLVEQLYRATTILNRHPYHRR